MSRTPSEILASLTKSMHEILAEYPRGEDLTFQFVTDVHAAFGRLEQSGRRGLAIGLQGPPLSEPSISAGRPLAESRGSVLRFVEPEGPRFRAPSFYGGPTVCSFVPKRTTPHVPGPPPERDFYFEVERRSAGAKRSFWTDAWELPGHLEKRSCAPIESWTSDSLHEICDEMATRLPAKSGDGPHSVALLVQPGGWPDRGDYLSLCVVRGRWRVRIGLAFENDLPLTMRQEVRRLPLTDDAWTGAALVSRVR